MEPEIVITKRLQEQINVVLDKKHIDSDFMKELEKYSTEENIPFRLVKQIHDILSQSGDYFLKAEVLILSFCTIVVSNFKLFSCFHYLNYHIFLSNFTNNGCFIAIS